MSGDFEKLAQLISKISSLSEVPEHAAPAVAKSVTGLLQRQFAESRDPYGMPWPEDKATKRGRHKPLLGPTRKLSEGTRATAQGSNVSVEAGAPYAVYQQKKRPILPEHGMPPTWSGAIKTAVTQQIEKKLR